jgi:hypothetical protein
MNIQEQQELQQHLQAISKLLVKNTPKEHLKDFESIELAVREHILTTVSPAISGIFLQKLQEQILVEREQ